MLIAVLSSSLWVFVVVIFSPHSRRSDRDQRSLSWSLGVTTQGEQRDSEPITQRGSLC